MHSRIVIRVITRILGLQILLQYLYSNTASVAQTGEDRLSVNIFDRIAGLLSIDVRNLDEACSAGVAECDDRH